MLQRKLTFNLYPKATKYKVNKGYKIVPKGTKLSYALYEMVSFEKFLDHKNSVMRICRTTGHILGILNQLSYSNLQLAHTLRFRNVLKLTYFSHEVGMCI